MILILRNSYCLTFYLQVGIYYLMVYLDVIIASATKYEKILGWGALHAHPRHPLEGSSIWHARWACRRLLSLCRRLQLSHIQIQISNLVGIYRLHKFSRLTVLKLG